MGKSENKTKPEKASVKAFIDAIPDEQLKKDCRSLQQLMEKITGEKAVMWGSSIVGFGKYHYKYESGREGDSLLTGFSPRKQNLTIYTNTRLDEDDPAFRALGQFKNGKSCIYVRKLEDIHTEQLEKLIRGGITRIRSLYG